MRGALPGRTARTRQGPSPGGAPPRRPAALGARSQPAPRGRRAALPRPPPAPPRGLPSARALPEAAQSQAPAAEKSPRPSDDAAEAAAPLERRRVPAQLLRALLRPLGGGARPPPQARRVRAPAAARQGPLHPGPAAPLLPAAPHRRDPHRRHQGHLRGLPQLQAGAQHQEPRGALRGGRRGPLPDAGDQQGGALQGAASQGRRQEEEGQARQAQRAGQEAAQSPLGVAYRRAGRQAAGRPAGHIPGAGATVTACLSRLLRASGHRPKEALKSPARPSEDRLQNSVIVDIWKVLEYLLPVHTVNALE